MRKIHGYDPLANLGILSNNVNIEEYGNQDSLEPPKFSVPIRWAEWFVEGVALVCIMVIAV